MEHLYAARPISGLSKTPEHLYAARPINGLPMASEHLYAARPIRGQSKTLEHLYAARPINGLTQGLGTPLRGVTYHWTDFLVYPTLQGSPYLSADAKQKFRYCTPWGKGREQNAIPSINMISVWGSASNQQNAVERQLSVEW